MDVRDRGALLVVVTMLAWGGAFGCMPASDAERGVGTVQQAIEDGEPADIAELMAVVQWGGCSGTYVGERTVLTAAHCFQPAFARGCGDFPPHGVRFADLAGDPHSPPGELRTAIAAMVHPLAYQAFAVWSCCTSPSAAGLDNRHDIALLLLDQDPQGIAPLPVVVAEGGPPPQAGVVFPEVRDWLDQYDDDPATRPIVTVCGYGLGSTPWPPDDMQGRDFGTTDVLGRTGDIGVPDCFGQPTTYPGDPLLIVNSFGANPEPGDSGSPLLAGAGEVKPGMVPPTPLPAPLAGRHVIGVASHHRNNLTDHGFAATWDPDNGAWLADRLHDFDGDDVDNNADNCPTVPNPGQDNCNADAEAKAGIAPVGDACDEVPCVRAAQASKTSGPKLHKVTSTTMFDVEPIRVAPGPTFSGEWGHRFCPCAAADGTPEAVQICESQHGCAISQGASFGDDGPSWWHTEVGLEPGPPPQLDAAFVHDFVAPAELQPGGVPATLDTMVWNAPLPPAPVPSTITGSHWFHVKHDACTSPVSCPPLVPQQTLDELASYYWAGEAGRYFALGGILHEIPQAFSWWFPLPPICPACRAFEVLPFAHVLPNGTLAMRTPAGDYQIDSQLTPAAIQALEQATGLLWLAPAEPAQLLWNAPVLLASISQDGSVAGPALQATPGGVDLVTPRPGSPPSRSRFGAVLRATEGDLLVVGGVLPGGQPAGDLWRYPILGGPWTVLDTGGITPGPVLAATYDGYHRRLIVLDEIGAAPHLQARLWSLEVDRASAHLLGAWPRTGHYDAFALGHAHDGSFVLLAARSNGAPLRVLRLQISAGEAQLESLRTSKGVPVAPPRTNQRGIHILIDHPGKQIVAERIDWAKLKPAGHKTLADYVR